MSVYYDPDDPYHGAPTGPPDVVPPPQAPTPPPTTTPPATPPPQQTPYSDAAFQAILRSHPPTVAGIQAAVAEANKLFGTNITISGSVSDKVTLPDGRVRDVRIAAHTDSPRWGWITPGGPTTAPDFGGSGIDPSYLTPWAGKPPSPGQPTPFIAPPEFRAPTKESLLQDPSYAWRVDQGRGAIENSAAARGTLNSGGTLSDILSYGQGMASQEYSNVWDRNFNVWDAKWRNALTEFGARKDVDDTMFDRAWRSYADSKDTHYRNQNEPFNKLFNVASLGVQAAR